MTRHPGRSIAAAALCLFIGWGGTSAAQDQPKVPGIAWVKPKPIAVPPRKPWPPIKPPVRPPINIALVMTPLFIGQNRQEATRLALASGLRPDFYGDNDARALVIIQSLPERWSTPRGTDIDLTLRDPPQPVTVETVRDYHGLDRQRAFDAVRGADLQPRFTGANSDAATVADQRPRPQAEVPAGSPVVLIMAAAPTSGAGGDGSNANGAGPPPNNQNSTTDGAAPNSQNPAAGGSPTNNQNPATGEGQANGVGVTDGGGGNGGAKSPPPTEPGAIGRFVGLTRQQASDLARRNGLEPQFIGASDDDARVADQFPGPDDRVARPALISLTLAAPQPPPQPPKSNVGLIAAAFAVGLGVATLAGWALRRPVDNHKPQPTPGIRVKYQADPGAQKVLYRLEAGDVPRSIPLPPRPPPEPTDV